ncbi:MAG: peptidylprolyl isomerase [Gammaproteobacteria bacterium]|nr:peptidylprolyl isomerase [Gammaproteobacteria bacterium]
MQVKIETSQGNMTLELYPEKAPKTVKNFLRYVDEGFYTDTVFHRVIANFMIQGGGFDKSYNRKATHDPVANEADNGLENNYGSIAMARTSDPDSATAQFFINSSNNRFLNHTRKSRRGWGYCVFGKVIDGKAVIEKISALKTGSGGSFPKDVPSPQVIINKISRL